MQNRITYLHQAYDALGYNDLKFTYRPYQRYLSGEAVWPGEKVDVVSGIDDLAQALYFWQYNRNLQPLAGAEPVGMSEDPAFLVADVASLTLKPLGLARGAVTPVTSEQSVLRSASGAESAALYAKLKELYRQTETYGSGGIRQMENGRFRFYGEVRAPRTPGEMAGQRTVREWDPATGNTRTWLETLDHSGRVRIVRPETGGPKIHYLFDAEGNYVGTF